MLCGTSTTCCWVCGPNNCGQITQKVFTHLLVRDAPLNFNPKGVTSRMGVNYFAPEEGPLAL